MNAISHPTLLQQHLQHDADFGQPGDQLTHLMLLTDLLDDHGRTVMNGLAEACREAGKWHARLASGARTHRWGAPNGSLETALRIAANIAVDDTGKRKRSRWLIHQDFFLLVQSSVNPNQKLEDVFCEAKRADEGWSARCYPARDWTPSYATLEAALEAGKASACTSANSHQNGAHNAA